MSIQFIALFECDFSIVIVIAIIINSRLDIIACSCAIIVVLCGMQIVALRPTVKKAKSQAFRRLMKHIKQYRSRKLVFFISVK